jgi:hypothetical protein
MNNYSIRISIPFQGYIPQTKRGLNFNIIYIHKQTQEHGNRHIIGIILLLVSKRNINLSNEFNQYRVNHH